MFLHIYGQENHKFFKITNYKIFYLDPSEANLLGYIIKTICTVLY